MGVCSSCLGLNRRASHDQAQTTRLLDDELYHSGYGYGAVAQSSQAGQQDTEDIKREREALESICQRASDSVVDIWSLQPQSHLNTQQVSHGSVSFRNAPTSTPSSSRIPSSETPSAVGEDGPNGGPPAKFDGMDSKQQLYQDTLRRAVASSSRVNGAVITPKTSHQSNLSAAPKHWGEVVMSTRKGKKVRPGLNLDSDGSMGSEVFGVLKVK
ncbi:hypothetical protein FQN54_001448 [Arachnomyces sp. PD_36]|nr:hypothetical protein FQN54_001448 [Arachnomyces sp. PD_36]